MRNKSKIKQEDEIPKSVLKMKKEKEKREELERNQRNGNKGKREKGLTKKELIKSKIKKVILFVIIAAIITIGILMTISAFTWKELTADMFNNENSIVLDNNGKEIAKLGVEQKKLSCDINEMPENLIDAYVSIEDERFYSHHGIDIKRTTGAILSYITNFGNSSYGGSTITQQLVKNLTGDSTDAITRKVKEWWKAFLLESYYSKEEILEMYLNIIYVGPNVYGVQAGSKYYFDKDVNDLSLAECAFLAGINNSPNSYNPFGDSDNTELITKRTSTVLNKMLELGKITKDEYDKAIEEVNEGLDFDNGSIKTENPIYSYHTDALISQVVSDIAEDKNISETFATNYLYLSGLKIYSTQDSDIQEEVEKEFLKKQYMIKSNDGESTAQAAMVIIDHKTGKILAVAGGLGEKETFRGLNRATQSQRQTGSSMKPLAVLVPGIDKKIFTPASIYNDEKTTFANGYAPGNSDGYLGNITVRRALESSQNVPFVEMMEQITPNKSISYLKNMGITSLTPGDESLALALGGLENGVTPLQMAGAYATIANDGQYIEPILYTKITNKEGDTILKTKQKTKKVFSEQVAYVVKELLKQPVEGNHGTATYCHISGIDVAAKTGTTDENYDRWLCGFTPYYTAVTWYGYDQNETIYYNNQNPAGIIWANVMRRVHDGLNNAKFEKPSKVVTTIICGDTGMVAKSGCPNTYEEYFLSGTLPDLCTKHSGNKANSTKKEEDTSSEVYVDKGEELELNPNDQEETPKEENVIEEEPEENIEENIVEENIVEAPEITEEPEENNTEEAETTNEIKGNTDENIEESEDNSINTENNTVQSNVVL